MVKIFKKRSSLDPIGNKIGCCKVESIINIDERGQLVLPKELRKKANIHPGDKFALVCLENKGTIYCFSLIKIEELAGIVKNLLSSMTESDSSNTLSR